MTGLLTWPNVMSEPEQLLTEKRSGTLIATLHRPEVANALNVSLTRELTEVLNRAAESNVALVVLKGTGSNFCGGFDLGSSAKDGPSSVTGHSREALTALEDLLQSVYEAPFMTAAFVQGGAIGSGADLVVACDYAVATADAHMSFPGFRAGVSLGTRRLVELVGRRRADEMVVLGRSVRGEALHESGLVSMMAEEAEWPEVLARLAESAAGDALRCRVRFNEIAKSVSRERSANDLRSSIGKAVG